MKQAFIIGEAGSCHDGSLIKAKELISIAAEAGASACKFQFWSSASQLAARRRSGAHYEAIYRQYQMPVEWLPILKEQCDHAGLLFMATAYLEADIQVVAPYVDHFKVASFEAADLDFIRAHYPHCEGQPDRWLIVSTGLQDQRVVSTMKSEQLAMGLHGTHARRHMVALKLLHCVSAYPAPPESLGMRQIRALGFDGFSDHAAAGWIASGAVAVALGAKILEVHVRLHSTDPKNPDAPHALVPEQLAEYIRHVRTAETAIGDEGWRSPTNKAEDAMRKFRVQP